MATILETTPRSTPTKKIKNRNWNILAIKYDIKLTSGISDSILGEMKNNVG